MEENSGLISYLKELHLMYNITMVKINELLYTEKTSAWLEKYREHFDIKRERYGKTE